MHKIPDMRLLNTDIMLDMHIMKYMILINFLIDASDRNCFIDVININRIISNDIDDGMDPIRKIPFDRQEVDMLT